MKKNLTFLFLLTVFCALPLFAQEKTSVYGNQCEMADKEDFASEKISFVVVNTDIRDILNYINEQIECDFVVEDKVGKVIVTTRIDDLPWNTALKTILKTHKLDMMVRKSSSLRNLIFIGTERYIYCERYGMLCCEGVYPPEKDTEQLYSEFIKLKNLPTCPINTKCEQTSIALDRLKTIIIRRLSKRGDFEIDESAQTLIITDVRDNLNALRSLVEFIDNAEFYNEVEKDK